MIADSGTFSDGEQQLLPVLSNKEHLVETLRMPVRGEEARTSHSTTCSTNKVERQPTVN
jgi:hypothetical protein